MFLKYFLATFKCYFLLKYVYFVDHLSSESACFTFEIAKLNVSLEASYENNWKSVRQDAPTNQEKNKIISLDPH